MLGRVVEREDRRLAVRTSVPRTLLAALASALAVALGAYLCAGSLVPSVFANPFFSPSARVLVFAAGAAVLFFGFALAFYLGRLFSFRRPIVEVGPGGIVDRSSALGAGFVAWEEVEAVGVRRFLGQRFLAVRVKDAQTLLARQSPPLKRWLMGINRRITGAPVNVPLGALAVREEVLLREIDRHLPRRGRSPGPG